jgi:hypothetical protein
MRARAASARARRARQKASTSPPQLFSTAPVPQAYVDLSFIPKVGGIPIITFRISTRL